jgi:hypothetical protein
VTSRASLDIYLLFLIKKGGLYFEATKKKIKKEYKAANFPYYSNDGKYMEVKYRLHNSKFQIDFYFELLKTFCSLGENFLGIYTRSKCMLVARVST